MNKPVQIVFCSHNPPYNRFLFVVPSSNEVKRGDKLYVDTMHGECEATAECDGIWVTQEQLEQIVPGTGAYWPLRFVTGRQIAVTELKRVPFRSTELEARL